MEPVSFRALPLSAGLAGTIFQKRRKRTQSRLLHGVRAEGGDGGERPNTVTEIHSFLYLGVRRLAESGQKKEPRGPRGREVLSVVLL
jgi:hypothetical protein